MDNNLDILNKYFFGGEAEAETEIRNEVFVPPHNLKKILSFSRSHYKILLGSKGVGKSLLINILNESALADNNICVLLTPDDFDCEAIAKKSTNSDKVSVAYNQLLRSIGAKLGQYSDDMVISDDESNLIKLSIEEGLTRPDLISRFSEFLAKATPVAGKFAQAALNAQRINTKQHILKSDIQSVLKRNEKKIWILIDDIDQASITTGKYYDYSVCWALVASCIELANDFIEVRSIVSVRTDIWHTMTVAKKHGSDRLDKIQKPIILKFKEEEVRNIFLKRIELSNNALGKNNNRSLDSFFEEDKLTLPGASAIKRSWDIWISKNSRNRPRDMVHLVQQLIESAEDSNQNRIQGKHAINIMLPYAKERIENIDREYREILPQIKAIIRDISTKSTFNFLEIIDLLSKSPSRRSTTIDNILLKPNVNESGIAILQVLYMANFINARRSLSKNSEEYEHLVYSEHPKLVNIDNWNKLQEYQWEIHPVFHQYIYEKNQSSNTRNSY